MLRGRIKIIRAHQDQIRSVKKQKLEGGEHYGYKEKEGRSKEEGDEEGGTKEEGYKEDDQEEVFEEVVFLSVFKRRTPSRELFFFY